MYALFALHVLCKLHHCHVVHDFAKILINIIRMHWLTVYSYHVLIYADVCFSWQLYVKF